MGEDSWQFGLGAGGHEGLLGDVVPEGGESERGGVRVGVAGGCWWRAAGRWTGRRGASGV